ncbi:hypothetical protein VSR34_38490 [Paraburkholderia sp. JHI2823]|uniref:hypothetical protein n=1 Tax=Paraburkholderia sp. JHI2823 TaxID=3112960 RepID=UPI00316F15D8
MSKMNLSETEREELMSMAVGHVRRARLILLRISGKLNARFGEVEQARREVLRSA